ncbi:DEAD/DEAH box helicase [Escherichia coli]
MAPTELLAEQHANNFRSWFEPLGVEVGWLGGKTKRQSAPGAAGGYRQRTGTDDCRHPRHLSGAGPVENGLALVIIDEQHRFGVHQRLALWEKGQQHDFTRTS